MSVNPYSSQSISGYNSSPPPDDGSQTSANKIEWAKHKSKLSDPIKTLAEAVNSQAVAAINTLALKDWSVSTTTATIAESDWHNGLLFTGTGNLNYPDPATIEDGWHNYVYNAATGIVRLAATATGFFRAPNGLSASGYDVRPGQGIEVLNTATVWLVLGSERVDYNQGYAEFATATSATAAIPTDGTIPQSGEGVQILTAAVQALSATTRWHIAVSGNFSTTASHGVSAALFKRGTADAKHAQLHKILALDTGLVSFVFEEAVGSTATVDWDVRVGPQTATQIAYINEGAGSGVSLFGAAGKWTLSVREVP